MTQRTVVRNDCHWSTMIVDQSTAYNGGFQMIRHCTQTVLLIVED